MIIELEELVKNGEIEIKTGPFGTQLKAAEYVESGTPVLNEKFRIFNSCNNKSRLCW